MLEIRSSNAEKKSAKLVLAGRSAPAETNTSWIARNGGAKRGDLILLGGTNLTHFRLRLAQADIRHDLLPSPWSHIVIVDAQSGKNDWQAWEVSLEGRDDIHLIPKNNGIRSILLSAYDDPTDFPNVACLRMTRKHKHGARARSLGDALVKFRRERLTLNVPALMADWLGWVWGVAEKGNPLTRGIGIPSAVLVEAVYALIGFELTPGLASQSSCPEAIWQSALWWHEFYKSDASLGSPLQGSYCVSQWEAAVLDSRSKSQDAAVRLGLYGPVVPRSR